MLENSSAMEFPNKGNENIGIMKQEKGNYTKWNLTNLYWQQAQDDQKHLNVSLDTMKEKSEHINASTKEMDKVKKNAYLSWPVHIDRFADEDTLKIGQPTYLTLFFCLPLFLLLAGVSLVYKAYRGSQSYRRRDHPEFGDDYLSQFQVVVDPSSAQHQYEHQEHQAQQDRKDDMSSARGFLEEIISLPRRRSLEKDNKPDK